MENKSNDHLFQDARYKNEKLTHGGDRKSTGNNFKLKNTSESLPTPKTPISSSRPQTPSLLSRKKNRDVVYANP